jgi:hypothetical protein
VYALWKSSLKINFFEVKLVSPIEVNNLPINVIHEITFMNKLSSIDDYNRYIIYDLWRHVKTDFCLLIQADGYVINPRQWESEFLNYDYIGAPWKVSDTAYIDPRGIHQRVGNGGFSLRSRKLLEIPNEVEIPWDVRNPKIYKNFSGLFSEDGNICVHNRHLYESAGCEWAPIEVALKFSFENKILEWNGEKTFGFHKNFPYFSNVVKDKFHQMIFWLMSKRNRLNFSSTSQVK